MTTIPITNPPCGLCVTTILITNPPCSLCMTTIPITNPSCGLCTTEQVKVRNHRPGAGHVAHSTHIENKRDELLAARQRSLEPKKTEQR